jgi:hypothetical protein
MRPSAFTTSRLLPVLGLWFLASSCTAMEPDAPPAGAVLMSPPAQYAAWYASTEACAQLTGAAGRIEWYVVPGVSTFDTSIGEKVGLWERVGNVSRITIAGNYTDNEMVVRHEMLHDLLERAGHPPEYFVTRCHLTWDSWNAGEQ